MNKKNKQTLKDTFKKAFQSYKKKDFDSAENICKKILSIDKHHFDSIIMLATVSAIKSNYEKAKDFLHRAAEIEPNNVSIFNNLGTTYKELGNKKEALNYYQKVLEIDSKHTNAHYNLGLVYYQMKDLKKSKEYFQKTILLQSNYALAYFNLGNVNVDLKNYNQAISCYQKAIEINPNIVGAHNNLGLVFRGLNDFKNAITCYEKVIKIKPDHAGAYHNLAMAYKELGQFDKAIKFHETAIKYESENSAHYYYLCELKEKILNKNLKNKLEKIIKNKKATKNNIAYCNFLLSKYENKTKNYKKELNYLIKGHESFFESKKDKFKLGVKYAFDDVLQISKGVSINKIDDKKNNQIKPIFIIGVPRCGSTLVEKIIASGKVKIPMGEEVAVIENFLNEKILEKQSLDLGEVNTVRDELNNIYKEKGLISEKYNYIFTDKSLNNFFYLNFVKDVYPEIKIINCKRNVLSSIMSILQNNLTELAWAHNIENIFKYFNQYFEIIENFKNQYPGFIYDLEFEKLINEPEKESKKLMQFCDLQWDKQCLDFYKRKDLISKTASNVQIRKAIYKHSKNKYAVYKEFLNEYGKKYSWFN